LAALVVNRSGAVSQSDLGGNAAWGTEPGNTRNGQFFAIGPVCRTGKTRGGKKGQGSPTKREIRSGCTKVGPEKNT